MTTKMILNEMPIKSLGLKGFIFASLITLSAVIACSKEDSNVLGNAPIISIGKDTTVFNSTQLNLNAVSVADSGRWTVVSGTGGQFENPTVANTKFTGSLNVAYKLRYASYNAFGSSADTICVILKSTATASEMAANIHWLGQADFRIETLGKIIYVDHVKPSGDKAADLILITHSHGDHFSPDAIAKVATANTIILGPADCNYQGLCKKFIAIEPGGEFRFNEFVSIKAVAAYNIVKTDFHPKANKCVGYLISSEGVTVYHAADTERIPEMKGFSCDIALMPLGSNYTMNSVDEAVEATKDVKAKIAIPMHWGLNEGSLADAETYKTKLTGSAEVYIKTKE